MASNISNVETAAGSEPDVREVVGAADAEGAHVVHGGYPGVVVVGAVAWIGAGGGVGWEGGVGGAGGVVGGLVMGEWVVGASGHRGRGFGA